MRNTIFYLIITSLLLCTFAMADTPVKADYEHVLLLGSVQNISYTLPQTTDWSYAYIMIDNVTQAALNGENGEYWFAWIPEEGDHFFKLSASDGDVSSNITGHFTVKGFGDVGSQTEPVVSGQTQNWFNIEWSKRKQIQFQSFNSNLYNVQVEVTINYDADMQPDFDDLRFTTSDGLTPINYFLESYTASQSAKVWLKIPYLPNQYSTIYMYYGNPSATSNSNGQTTFSFFDDFNDGVLSGWTTHIPRGTIQETNGHVVISSNGQNTDWWSGNLEYAPIMYIPFPDNTIAEVKMTDFTTSTNAWWQAGMIGYLNRDNAYLYGSYEQQRYRAEWIWNNNGQGYIGGQGSSGSKPIYYGMYKRSGNIYFDLESSWLSHYMYFDVPYVGLFAKSWLGSYDITAYFDYFRMRQYVDHDIVVQTNYPEEAIEDYLNADGEPCTVDSECVNVCKYDFDGSGGICAPQDKCVHDNVFYSNGEHFPDCYSPTTEYLCNAGTWVSNDCNVGCSGGENICLPDGRCSNLPCNHETRIIEQYRLEGRDIDLGSNVALSAQFDLTDQPHYSTTSSGNWYFTEIRTYKSRDSWGLLINSYDWGDSTRASDCCYYCSGGSGGCNEPCNKLCNGLAHTEFQATWDDGAIWALATTKENILDNNPLQMFERYYGELTSGGGCCRNEFKSDEADHTRFFRMDSAWDQYDNYVDRLNKITATADFRVEHYESARADISFTRRGFSRVTCRFSTLYGRFLGGDEYEFSYGVLPIITYNGDTAYANDNTGTGSYALTQDLHDYDYETSNSQLILGFGVSVDTEGSFDIAYRHDYPLSEGIAQCWKNTRFNINIFPEIRLFVRDGFDNVASQHVVIRDLTTGVIIFAGDVTGDQEIAVNSLSLNSIEILAGKRTLVLDLTNTNYVNVLVRTGFKNGMACTQDGNCADKDCNPTPSGQSFCTEPSYECALDSSAGVDVGYKLCHNGDATVCTAENTWTPEDCYDTCGYYVDQDSCSAGVCTTTCATSCPNDGACDANAHCDNAVCLADLGNEMPCDENSDCISGDCNAAPTGFGYCTDSAYSCATTSGTGVMLGSSLCHNNNKNTCVSDELVNSWSSTDCFDPCGFYPQVDLCTAGECETCPTSCAVDGDCDEIAHCDDAQCLQDLPNGAACDEDSDCQGSYCVHNICRSTPTFCTDSFCDAGEHCGNCVEDCACGAETTCKVDTCLLNDGSSCSEHAECYGGECCNSVCQLESVDCCGNNMCEVTEEYYNCFADCHCGDGECQNSVQYEENDVSCPEDCVDPVYLDDLTIHSDIVVVDGFVRSFVLASFTAVEDVDVALLVSAPAVLRAARLGGVNIMIEGNELGFSLVEGEYQFEFEVLEEVAYDETYFAKYQFFANNEIPVADEVTFTIFTDDNVSVSSMSPEPESELSAGVLLAQIGGGNVVTNLMHNEKLQALVNQDMSVYLWSFDGSAAMIVGKNNPGLIVSEEAGLEIKRELNVSEPALNESVEVKMTLTNAGENDLVDLIVEESAPENVDVLGFEDSRLISELNVSDSIVFTYTIIVRQSGNVHLSPLFVVNDQDEIVGKAAGLFITVPCLENGICDYGENSDSCPNECKTGTEDLVCDYKHDGTCDPDCPPNADPDCGGCGDGYCAGALAGETFESCPEDCQDFELGDQCKADVDGICDPDCPGEIDPDCAAPEIPGTSADFSIVVSSNNRVLDNEDAVLLLPEAVKVFSIALTNDDFKKDTFNVSVSGATERGLVVELYQKGGKLAQAGTGLELLGGESETLELRLYRPLSATLLEDTSVVISAVSENNPLEHVFITLNITGSTVVKVVSSEGAVPNLTMSIVDTPFTFTTDENGLIRMDSSEIYNVTQSHDVIIELSTEGLILSQYLINLREESVINIHAPATTFSVDPEEILMRTEETAAFDATLTNYGPLSAYGIVVKADFPQNLTPVNTPYSFITALNAGESMTVPFTFGAAEHTMSSLYHVEVSVAFSPVSCSLFSLLPEVCMGAGDMCYWSYALDRCADACIVGDTACCYLKSRSEQVCQEDAGCRWRADLSICQPEGGDVI